ncbi:DUF333 domain-containing protein [Qingshengfaniella alkalisoli]|uniref:DUF333 domain-containing protein n=2 Tax=Qingshengfaniella alkalisoli TaxID=2599296 RepID=A0A5B8I8J1_9RHOB|nr:DUF333 domain-containing protein [Qingshengfaniella alkalisoli]
MLTACEELQATDTVGGSAGTNPAAVYCIESGGRHEIRDTEGGQVGVCILPDGREVDAWDYFRAQNPNGQDG